MCREFESRYPLHEKPIPKPFSGFGDFLYLYASTKMAYFVAYAAL